MLHCIQKLGLYTKIGDSRFSRSGDMTTGIKSKKGSSCDPDHALFTGALLTESSDLI